VDPMRVYSIRTIDWSAKTRFYHMGPYRLIVVLFSWVVAP
jgi:hypothetical protein